MTESNLSSNMAAPEGVEESVPNRRKTLLVGTAAAVVLGAAGFLLLGGSSGGSDPQLGLASLPKPLSHAAAPSKAKAAAATKAKALKVIPAVSKEHLGRDPFKALYVAPAATGPGSGTTGSTGTPSTGTPSTGTPSSSTGTNGIPATGRTGSTGTPVTGTPVTGTPVTSGGSTGAGSIGTSSTGTGSGTGAQANMPYALTLKAISKPSPEVRFFTFDVGGKSATVIVGQRFGKYGELQVLAYTKSATGQVTGAVLQVGDDNPIQIKIGDKISVI